jgi:hypothetical protein
MSGIHHLDYFAKLKIGEAAIASELGNGIEWRELPQGKESHIRRRYEPWNPSDRNDWPRQHEQMRRDLEAFKRCFTPKVKEIEIDFVNEE